MDYANHNYAILAAALKSLVSEMEKSMEHYRSINIDFINSVFDEGAEVELGDQGVLKHYHNDFAHTLQLMQENILQLKLSQSSVALKDSIHNMEDRMN